MMLPDERVRMATAPSTVMLFSSERLPLMLKPPLPKVAEAAVVEVAADDAGLEAGDANRVAAREGQLLDVLGLDRLADRDVGLQRRGVGGDGDHFGQRAGLEREGQVDLGGRVELDGGARGLLEAVELDRDVVQAGHQRRKRVVAGRVSDGGRRLLGLRPKCGDGDTGHDTAGLVGDDTRDTGALELGESDARHGNEQRRGERDTAPYRAELGGTEHEPLLQNNRLGLQTGHRRTRSGSLLRAVEW